MKTTKKYTFIVKKGPYKNRIIDWVYASSRYEAEKKMETTLIDVGDLVGTIDFKIGVNYRIKTEEAL